MCALTRRVKLGYDADSTQPSKFQNLPDVFLGVHMTVRAVGTLIHNNQTQQLSPSKQVIVCKAIILLFCILHRVWRALCLFISSKKHIGKQSRQKKIINTVHTSTINWCFFTALTLLVGWQEMQASCEKPA